MAQLTFFDWQYNINGFGTYQNAILTRYIGTSSDVSIPSTINGLSVQFLNNAAFDCNSTITNVSFPSDNIGIIGNDTVPFSCCRNLVSINVDPFNPFYSSSDGVFFTKKQTTLLKYPMGRIGNYDIPAGVTRIGTYSFYTCTNLTGVTIPNSVTNIVDYGFSGCLGLNTVTIPASVATIGYAAFDGCDQLTNIVFLGNAPSVGMLAFAYDYKGPPKTIYYLPGTTGWGSTFAGFPTAPLVPALSSPSMQSGQFGFYVSGPVGTSVVLESSTSLTSGPWIPQQTNTLTGSPWYFTDPAWANYPLQFYRVRSQ
jgi:hypothetical protein